MDIDPNWLYSTIAQSSAAIVAIIGGFITASVLTLSAEKRSLNHQRDDRNTLSETLKRQESELSNLYETMRVDDFFHSIAKDLKKEQEIPALEELLKRYPNWKLDIEILKREYEKLSKRRLEARDFIEAYSDIIDPSRYISFDDWVRQNNLDISVYDQDLLDDEYDRCRERKEEILEKQKEEEEQRRISQVPSYMRGIFDAISRPIYPIFPNIRPPELRVYEYEKEDRKMEYIEKRLDSLRSEISVVGNEIANLTARIESFSYPPNMGWGIVVLGFLAVFSILLPIIVLAFQAYFMWARILTTVTFWIGIIGVFAYIVLQIRTLKK